MLLLEHYGKESLGVIVKTVIVELQKEGSLKSPYYEVDVMSLIEDVILSIEADQDVKCCAGFNHEKFHLIAEKST